jgi:hypothetical protein
MDLKQMKKIVSYAKKNGIKSLKVDGFEIEFDDKVPFPKSSKPVEPMIPTPTEITLDDINDYIYADTDAELN